MPVDPSEENQSDRWEFFPSYRANESITEEIDRKRKREARQQLRGCPGEKLKNRVPKRVRKKNMPELKSETEGRAERNNIASPVTPIIVLAADREHNTLNCFVRRGSV